MRARNIKPGFLKNEDLADLGPFAQLLFIGLWQLADRDGKLEDRPRRIKAEVFPYYDPKPSITNLLNQLSEKKFILRYRATVDGKQSSLIKIINFHKHQSPHHTEKKSIFPDPCDIYGELTVNPPSNDGENPPDSLNHERGIMNHEKRPRSKKISLPSDFLISDSVKTWAQVKGYDRLEEHLEAFIDYVKAHGKEYIDWEAAFKKAIREDWGKIRTTPFGKPKEDAPEWTKRFLKKPSGT